MFPRAMPLAATAVVFAAAVGGCGGARATEESGAAEPGSQASAERSGGDSGYDEDDGGAENAPQGQGSAGDAGKISVIGNAFAPATVTVEAGDTVTFTNQDGATHTATAQDGFDLELAPGSSRDWKAKRGEWSYLCTVHAGMTGTISVQ